MSRGKVHFAHGSLTLTQVKAGTVIVEGRKGKSVMVVGGQMISTGKAATATSIDVKDTAGTPVVAVACAVAGLTDGAQLDFDAASNVTRTTYRAKLTVDQGLQIADTGTALTGTTALEYYVEYVYVD